MRIGVFDSGIGGISVLIRLAREFKNAEFIYYGDNKNAPYGNKSDRDIIKLSLSALPVIRQVRLRGVLWAKFCRFPFLGYVRRQKKNCQKAKLCFCVPRRRQNVIVNTQA